ncbi:MAG: electron transfer flavoprotein subunit alpha/FixB family protein [Planctomycetaceae bacterium]
MTANSTHVLVVAELERGQVKGATLAAVSCAQQMAQATGGRFDILALGHETSSLGDSLGKYGAGQVYLADSADLKNPQADNAAQVITQVAKSSGATVVIAASSTFSKDILPRVAAQLDAGMLTDVLSVTTEGNDWTFQRALFAGNVIATVALDGPIKVFTVRASTFAAPTPAGSASPVASVELNAAALPNQIKFVSRDEKPSGRPDATEARIVVSGGRALKNSEDFERLVGGLADVLGAAVGSSRALVDAGITPNALQIGQTGKVVAPELYMALGMSGAIQHLAGMKDSKRIVAVNTDPEAPIFEVADYGLVGDIYQVVPELIQKLK